ncbi:MAG: hypothetical protein ACRDR6_26910, partial [Pseudonocardiaceae bacterium]
LMISDGYRWPLYSDDDTTPIKRSLPEDLPEAHPTTPSNLTVPSNRILTVTADPDTTSRSNTRPNSGRVLDMASHRITEYLQSTRSRLSVTYLSGVARSPPCDNNAMIRG